jgi:hypothetical protein
VWLHADDSCMFSFQSGGFVTHLLPRAAAAGWETAAATAAAAAAGGCGEHLLPHEAEHGLSSWHEVRHSSSAAAAEHGVGPTAAAAAAAGAGDHLEPLSLQLRHLRLPAGHAAAGSPDPMRLGSLEPTASPRAAVDRSNAISGADGLIDGAIDASQMSRVYAASALPEVPVAAVAGTLGSNSSSSVAAGCGGPALKLPVGQVAARALKFR